MKRRYISVKSTPISATCFFFLFLRFFVFSRFVIITRKRIARVDPKGELVSYDKLGVFFVIEEEESSNKNKRWIKKKKKNKKKEKKGERDRESFARKR